MESSLLHATSSSLFVDEDSLNNSSNSRSNNNQSLQSIDSAAAMMQLELVHVKFFGRTSEQQTLEKALVRVIQENANEAVMIIGGSGTGKSRLVDTFRLQRIQTSALYACGKCDMVRSQEPYFVIQQAFQELLETIDYTLRRNKRDDIVRNIKEALGMDARGLADVLPGLSELIGATLASSAVSPPPSKIGGMMSSIRASSSAMSVSGGSISSITHSSGAYSASTSSSSSRSLTSNPMDTAMAQDRINYLFRTLVRAITRNTPVVLFIDDMQWIDAASIDIITSLLTDSAMKGLFIIGAYRGGEVGEGHLVTRALTAIEEKKGEAIPSMELKNLSIAELNAFIAGILRIEPNSCIAFASIVYEKTRGNVFFALQFLQLLHERDLLIWNTDKMQWTWVDPQQLRNDTSLTDNVVDLIATKLKQLSEDGATCLKIAACLSSTISKQVLKRVIEGLDIDVDVESQLKQAALEGFLVVKKDNEGAENLIYRFAHDRIQQAAYSLFPSHVERDEMHYRIGKLFLKLLDSGEFQDQNRDLLRFVVADQLQRGKSRIRSEADLLTLANLNLQAGKRAMALAAFTPAALFLSHGIETMLEVSRPWERHHALQVELHQSLADVSWCIGEAHNSERLVGLVVRHSQTFEERMKAHVTLAHALGCQGKFVEAVEVEVQQLIELKVMPKYFRSIKVITMLLKLKGQLRKRRIEELVGLPICRSKNIIAAFQLLRMLSSHATFAGDDILQAITALLGVKLMLKYGVHTTSVPFFAQIGILICLFFGDPKEGKRLGQLCTQLEERLGFTHAFKAFLVECYLNPWCSPLADSIEPLLQAYKVGMKQGNVEWSLTCFNNYLIINFLSGLSLRSLLQDAKSHHKVALEYGIESMTLSLMVIRQGILNVAGEARNPTVLTGDSMEEQSFLDSTDSNLLVYHFYIWKAQACFYYGKLKLADEALDNAKKHKKAALSFPEVYMMMFLNAMIPLCLALETRDKKYVRRARKAVAIVRKAVQKENKGINLAHKLLLMEAMFLAISPKSSAESVRLAFDKAASTSNRAGFRQDAALTSQLAGTYFAMNSRDENWAGYYISRSAELYNDWGSEGLARLLGQRYRNLSEVNDIGYLRSTDHQGRSRYSGVRSLSVIHFDTATFMGSMT